MGLDRTIEIRNDNPGLIRFRLGPSKLYLDDIRLICKTLRKASEADVKDSKEIRAAAPVVIAAGKAIAESAEDLRDAWPDELRTLKIALGRPVVSVELYRRSAAVTAQSSDVEGRAIALGVRDYVNGKRSLAGVKIFKSPGDALLIMLIIVACLAIISTIIYFTNAPRPWLIIPGSAVGLFVLATLIRSLFLYLTGTIKVVPREHSEVRGLTLEARKQLLIALAGAIVGGLIVGIAGLWAGGAIHH